jgi:hypothetical protein
VFQEKSEVTERKLRKFFSEVREKAIGDYGVAVTKATKTAEEKSDLGDQTVAADTIGVQVKSLAQFHLRNMELHLGLAAADADMLRAIALGDPLLAPDCFVLLSQMKAALQEARPGKPLAGLDARHSAKIEFEKLIWALLIPNDPRLSPTEIKEITETAGIQTGPGERATAGGAVLSAELRRPQPPPRLVKYWGERFFAGEKLDDEEIKERLRKLKADFLAKSDSERLIQVNSVPFKEET